jgi:hypothetical protein
MEKASGKKLETIDRLESGDTELKVGTDGRPLARHVCSMLTDDGRCSVYEDRPMICRLFGAANGMECHRGCKCDKPLTITEGMALLNDAMRIGGRPATHPDVDTGVLREVLSDPETRREWETMLAKFRADGNDRINRKETMTRKVLADERNAE